MMRITVDERWRVRASVAIEVPLRASVVWGQMRDFKRFLTFDPLHREVRVVGPAAPARARARARAPTAPIPVGTRLVIKHRLLAVGPDRDSRLLWWKEGRGFAVSDMSRRGIHTGFPHVCVYEITSIGTGASRLTVSARGRWTARWVPRSIVRFWLAWVLTATSAHLRWTLACWRTC